MNSNDLAGFNRSLILFGCGNMTSAMLGQWLAHGLEPANINVVRPSGKPVGANIRVVTHASAAGPAADFVLIGLKPQQLAAASADIATLVGPHTVVMSILAGVTVDDLRTRFPNARARLRVMPNMPVRTGRGVVGLAGSVNKPDARAEIDRLMAPLGLIHWIEDESQFDALTALTGSGPAFVYRFVDAMRAGAERLGFDSETALKLARATLDGAAAELANPSTTPADLATRVASRGGMTQAGLDVLDDDSRLASLMTETLRAARDRGKELAALARDS